MNMYEYSGLRKQTSVTSGRVTCQSHDEPVVTTNGIVSAERPCRGPEDTWQLRETLLRRPESSLQPRLGTQEPTNSRRPGM